MVERDSVFFALVFSEQSRQVVMGLPRLPRDIERSNLRWQLRHLVSADIGGATTQDKVDTNTSNTDSRSEPSLGGRFAINSRDVALSQRARLYLPNDSAAARGSRCGSRNDF